MAQSSRQYLYVVLTWSFATVWAVNGLYCKILDGVPRHRAIVERILGVSYAGFFTRLIGVGEVLMAIWIVSGRWSRGSAIAQVVLVGIMNAMEFFMAPDLLLFGRINAVVACCYMVIVYLTEFVLHRQIVYL
jgi:uncharacterized membrane protein YphA (DoxX/SURF4 family)